MENDDRRMTKKTKLCAAIATAALALEGWALLVVSVSPARWRPTMIARDEPAARAIYETMIEKLQKAERLSYMSSCSGPDARASFHNVRLEKPDRLYLDAVNGMSSKTTTAIGDGNNIWIYFSGDRPFVRTIDDDESHERTISEVYVRQATTGERNSAAADMDLLGRAWYGLILDPEIFHGRTDPLEPYIDGIRYRGRNKVGSEMCDVIEITYMNAHRARHFWISTQDHLPRRIKEIIRLAENHVTVEEWMKPDTDPEIPPRTFTWSPPEGWRQWTPPSPERFLLPAGSQAPDFELRSAGSGTISLSAYRGKVVWLHVWQAGSLHGREQMRHLQSLHDKHRDKGLAILGFNCVDDRRIAQTFLRDNAVTFPTVLDATEAAQRVVSVGLASRTLSEPLTCIINRDGKVVDAWYGSEKSKRRGAAAFKDAGLQVETE